MADFKTFDGYKLKDVQGRETLGEIEAYIGYPDDNVLGLSADFENNDFIRLGMAKNLNPGSDFNVFKMYGDRKLCNLADDGTITAWYGDPNYTETGYTTVIDPDTQEESTIQVQVMVRQPKFYYKVVPIKLEPITSTDPTQTGVHGYSGVKIDYYISDKPLPGFKLHPAFINANGDEVDCYYIGAYEACLFDASEDEYRLYDTWAVTYNSQTGVYSVGDKSSYLADKDYDKLSSIANVKPASGASSTQFTRSNVNDMAKNRGSRWGSMNIKILSAERLLSVIENAQFNDKNSIGRGVIDVGQGTTYNLSAFTGSTSSIGNGSGSALSTSRLRNDGVLSTFTDDGYVSVRYRGVENLWGNIGCFISGSNAWGDGTMDGGEVYICDDFNYADSTITDNYKPVGFTLPNGNGYIRCFGYSKEYDWVFLPSKSGGTASLPVGSYVWVTSGLNAYTVTVAVGFWGSYGMAGMTSWSLTQNEYYKNRTVGARLCYV